MPRGQKYDEGTEEWILFQKKRVLGEVEDFIVILFLVVEVYIAVFSTDRRHCTFVYR
jgi:hypothetical protein